ncbi:outer membrane protein transport protein [Acinetobacter sp. ASP199]|uniref:outer membrane protein transport protein n=1 Tax=unclassified Acinetobacter TaxID=196816 RepID=UPI001F6049DC|nr:outer membrane protein transport protein [Acinetobacter sp. ASP199]UNT59933.1 outer membrane protein transport protein [Acinetobacter sp. ASP199]
MKLNPISIAILSSFLPTTLLHAAALDRSSQSISGFLQPDNYVDLSYSILDADLSGKMRSSASGEGRDFDSNGWNMPSADRLNLGGELAGSSISDIAERFGIANFNLKYQVNEKVSIGLIYDQPFGAKSSYQTSDKRHDTVTGSGLPVGSNHYKLAENYGTFHSVDGGTSVDVNTHNLTLLAGYHPTEQITVYGGLAYQSISGELKLRGTAYGPLGGYLCNTETTMATMCTVFKEKGTGTRPSSGTDPRTDYKGYEAEIPSESAFGLVLGAAYQIPEIALRASLTYRSKIEYDMNVKEKMPEVISDTLPLINAGWHVNDKIPALGTKYQYTEGKTTISTPQSINLDFQSGIMANTLAYVNLRWVDWSSFSVRPHKAGILSEAITLGQDKGPDGFNLISYKKDQISAIFGIARKLNDKLALSIIGGWDSGLGEYTTTLGPSDGFWSAGFGGQYSFTPKTFVQAGARYFWMGDAKSQSASWYGTSRYDADFKDNTAIGMSVKLAHRF